MTSAGFTNRHFHSKGIAFAKQKEYSFLIGSIPLQKVTFLEHIALHFDQVVFFPICKYALLSLNHEHRPISERTWYNTSGRKNHVTQKVPATGIFQSNAVSLQTKNDLQKWSHYFEEHACFSPSNTILIRKLDGCLKKMLHMWHKYCYIVLSRVSMRSFF